MGSKPHAFVYVETDLPEGVTLSEWRRAKEHARSGRSTSQPAQGAPDHPTQPSAARHRYLRPTVRETRRHGEPYLPQRRAA